MDDRWTRVDSAEGVRSRPEILTAAESIFDGWFARQPEIDWGEFVDKLDGIELADGTRLDLGGDTQSPAIRAIRRHVNAYRKL